MPREREGGGGFVFFRVKVDKSCVHQLVSSSVCVEEGEGQLDHEGLGKREKVPKEKQGGGQ